MVKRSRQQMLLKELIEPYKNETVLVATSAGSDSMALLSLFYEQGVRVAACYVHHQQRLEENQQEIACLEAYCASRDIPFVVKEIDVEGQNNGNNQAYFRSERYRLLKTCAEEMQIKLIATGHHKNDQTETQFMHLLKGYGLQSLGGIKQEQSINGIVIIRPLLTAEKTQIMAYLEEQKIMYCDDSSNAEDVYLRNVLRNTVFPQLEERHAGAITNIAEHLDDVAELFQYTLLQECQNTLFLQEKEVDMTELQAVLKGKPAVLQRALVKEVLQRVYGYKELVSKQLLQIIITYIYTPKQVRLALTREYTLVKVMGKLQLLEKSEAVAATTYKLRAGEQNIGELSLDVRCTERQKTADETLLLLPQTVWEEELVISRHLPGDQIMIQAGRKKLTRVYIDAKIPKELRTNLLVLRKEHSSEVIYDFATKRMSYQLIQKAEAPVYLYWKIVDKK